MAFISKLDTNTRSQELDTAELESVQGGLALPLPRPDDPRLRHPKPAVEEKPYVIRLSSGRVITLYRRDLIAVF